MESGHMSWRKSSCSNANGVACAELGIWRKASYRDSHGGNCVELVRRRPQTAAIRDSKDPDRPRLAFNAAGWRSSTRQVKAGGLSPA